VGGSVKHLRHRVSASRTDVDGDHAEDGESPSRIQS
jgi:hypothetical protein